MISARDLKRIESLSRSFWVDHVKTDEFRALFKGKEIGHRIADYVDENTTAMLERNFNVLHEVGAKGEKRSRSMGDVWIKSNGIYNPVNVKAGESGKNGQPNMVSLSKLLTAILNREIDSYYLLILKMEIPANASVGRQSSLSQIIPHVYLVDMLDCLDFVTFDSGPGQAMLKEKQFYEAYEAGHKFGGMSISEKLGKMIELYEDGNRRLLENRKKKLDRIRARFRAHDLVAEHIVDQSGLTLG